MCLQRPKPNTDASWKLGEVTLHVVAGFLSRLWDHANINGHENAPIRRLSSEEVARLEFRSPNSAVIEERLDQARVEGESLEAWEFILSRRLEPFRCPIYTVNERPHNVEQQLEPVPPEIRAAAGQYNKCNSSVYCMLPLAKKIVESLDPEAEVDCLWLRPSPNILFIEGSADAMYQEPAHCAILVTLPDQDSFVIDLSGAQFGIKPDRVYSWLEYRKDWVASKEERSGRLWTIDTLANRESFRKNSARTYLNGRLRFLRRAFLLAYDEWIPMVGGAKNWWTLVLKLEEEEQNVGYDKLLELINAKLTELGNGGLQAIDDSVPDWDCDD